MSSVLPRVQHVITITTFYDPTAKAWISECDSLVHVDDETEQPLTFAARSGPAAQALALRALADAINGPLIHAVVDADFPPGKHAVAGDHL